MCWFFSLAYSPIKVILIFHEVSISLLACLMPGAIYCLLFVAVYDIVERKSWLGQIICLSVSLIIINWYDETLKASNSLLGENAESDIRFSLLSHNF